MLHLHHLLLQPLLPLFFCSPFLHRFFSFFLLPLCLSLIPCCLLSSPQCDVSSCFAFYLELSALLSVLWGGVSVLSQPQLFGCMAPLKLMFFGVLAVGSSCCHFFSGTKAILFGEEVETRKNLAGQEPDRWKAERIVHFRQVWRRSSEMSDSPHDGAMLWLGGTSSTG